ncbi:MerR family transcriptional regulator [Bacillus sp. FJAT-27445]|uniref:MerR family transcriptional regulator n=1 Tax=Bacillus sp. FJAT-27445 TaxID=1679166 RepID=UPI0007434E9D|nr:MerR family transcriptional regulator [Bacillus sp. FJAT-27445]
MPARDGKYNIKAVSKMLGIQPGTLRAWERRYGVISPGRSASGHRLYSESQLETLQEIIAMIEEGFTIGQAVAQLGPGQLAGNVEKRTIGRQDHDRSIILDAFRQFDEGSAHRAFDTCFSTYSFEAALSGIYLPLLTDMNRLLKKGELNNAQIRFGSAIIRSRLEGAIKSTAGKKFLPKVITLCAPGELEEFWIVLFTAFLKIRGFEIVYLGGGLTDEDIEQAIVEIKPRFVFFSCTSDESAKLLVDLSPRWEQLVPAMKIGAGGPGLRQLAANGQQGSSMHLYLGETPAEWAEWIKARLDNAKPFTNIPH